MTAEEKKTILLVDDAAEDLVILNETLKSEYRVLPVTNTEAALRILQSPQLPDLILLDVMMPDVDGIRFCRKIKAEKTTRDIPVIFVTAKDAVEDEADGFAAGGVDYITKPVNPHLVRARVRTHLELKLARENLERKNEILRENARLREEVEHISRHDLKNPLMVIMNIPTMLARQDNITPEQREWLKMIVDAGRKMLEMINRSIDLYKMENRTYDLHPASMNALAIVRQIATAHKRSAEQKRVEIDVVLQGKPPGDLEVFPVVAEELLFYSMISNLLINAVEASPPGGRVTLSLSGEEAAVIAIHNAGAIPNEIRSRFFEKFATAGKPGGTGLGAYSARLIADTLAGSITFESSEAAGTTITVTLPRPKERALER